MREQIEPTEERAKLESAAGVVRSQLLHDLDSLTDRRDRLVALFNSAKREAREHRALLIGVGIGAAILVGGAMLIARVRARRDVRRHWLRSVLSPWIADMFPARAPSQGFVKKTLRRAGGEIASLAVAEVGRRSLALLPTSDDPGRGVDRKGREGGSRRKRTVRVPG